jgi:hypothetical protein
MGNYGFYVDLMIIYWNFIGVLGISIVKMDGEILSEEFH